MRIIHHLQWQHRKDYARAKEYFQKGLAIARDMGNRERICTLLANLGTLAREEGDYARAKGYFQEGLVIARQMGHQEKIDSLLANLNAL